VGVGVCARDLPSFFLVTQWKVKAFRKTLQRFSPSAEGHTQLILEEAVHN